MKQFKLVTLLVGASLLSTMSFAESPYKGMTMPASAAPYNWTGFYVGLNAGFVQHTLNMTDTNATTFLSTIQQVTNPDLTGGFQVGYRRQVNLSPVTGLYGVELSADFANASFNKQYGSDFALYQLNAKNTLKDTAMLQLIGGIAADRTLLFVAAGLSWANITGNVTNLASIPFFNSFSVDKKAFGTALGGGIEYAYNDKVSVRFKVDVITPNTYSTTDNIGDSFQISNSIVQGTFGVNYKFG